MSDNLRVRSGLRIPFDLNTKLILLAQQRGVSKNSLMLEILWSHVERKSEGKANG